MQVNNTLQFGDTISVFKGNHNMKFGADMRWQQTNGADSAGQQGLFAFSPNETALPTAAGRAASGNAFASYLLGAVDNASYNGLYVVPGLRYQYKALFAQDDWKVSRKLTLNIGLRWDLFMPRREHNTNISGFDPSLPNPGAGNLLGAIRFLGNGPGRDNSRSSFADTYYKAFGPRIGFAYQLDPHTVVRGGYGVSYGQGNANAGLRDSQKFIYGFNAAPSYASTDAGVTPAFNWDSGFPTNWPHPPFIDPTVQNGTNVTMVGKGDGRPPYFQNYQIGVQQELAAQDLDRGGLRRRQRYPSRHRPDQPQPGRSEVSRARLGAHAERDFRGGADRRNQGSLCRLYRLRRAGAPALSPVPQHRQQLQSQRQLHLQRAPGQAHQAALARPHHAGSLHLGEDALRWQHRRRRRSRRTGLLQPPPGERA